MHFYLAVESVLVLIYCDCSILGNVHVGWAWVIPWVVDSSTPWDLPVCPPSTHGRLKGLTLFSMLKERVCFSPNCHLSCIYLLMSNWVVDLW